MSKTQMWFPGEEVSVVIDESYHQPTYAVGDSVIIVGQPREFEVVKVTHQFSHWLDEESVPKAMMTIIELKVKRNSRHE